MTVLKLQEGVVYGPLYSRRLGRSLGINLLPVNRKVCSFDCVYCHYRRTDVHTLRSGWEAFPPPEIVLREVGQALRRHQAVDYLTFSGNGEPTLHPHFPAIVAGVRRLRDELAPAAQLALFSNATTVQQPSIRESLALIDAPIMKLDAGDPETFARLNRPCAGVELEPILEGLRGLPNLIVQTILIEGEVTNSRGAPFEAWLEALATLRPLHVQLYSAERPGAETGVERVLPYVLERIAAQVRERTGFEVTAYYF